MTALSITCPRCELLTHDLTDIEQGYCASCCWWTSDPMLGKMMLDGQHHRRCRRSQCIGCMADQDIVPSP
jgi:hypothetical protein